MWKVQRVLKNIYLLVLAKDVNSFKVASGIFLLVVPILLGIVLPGILIVVIPSLSMIAGVVLFLDGIGAFARESEQKTLSQLEMTILRMLSQGSKIESIATATGVSALVIEQKIRELQKEGYLSADKLTEKGYNAIQVS